MSVQKITPYFFFNGQAEAAMELYQRALGARPEGVLRWGDHPQMCPVGKERQIMHAALHVGPALVFISDAPEKSGASAAADRKMAAVAISVDDPTLMQGQFNALAEGGTIVEVIHDAFWGEKFGVVRDRFGITWMFTCHQDSSKIESV
jgi:PhnB protein